MKKILLIGSFLFAISSMKAQTILTENFEGTGIPAGWVQTSLASDGGWKQGSNLASQSFPIPAHTKMIATNDDGCGQTCDKSNDFIQTPSFSLTGISNVVLKFDLFFYAGSYQGATESLNLEISTNGGSSWSPLQTLTGFDGWRTEIINLSTYVGNADVKIGFRYNDGAGWTFGAAVDNFSVAVPSALDLSVTSLNLPTFIALNQGMTVSGEISNFGTQAVTSMTLNYSIDNGTPVTQSLSGLNIPSINGTYTFNHSVPYTPSTVGTKILKVWASNINGGTDGNTANDEMSGSLVVASQVVTRVTCIEEFTSSTCAPCASLNSTFDPLLTANFTNDASPSFVNVTAVKYQMNWPSPGNDPSYNPDGVTRQNYYGVTGIPDVYFDGLPPASTDQTAIDKARWANPAIMSLSATSTITGNTISVTASLTPHISVPSGTKMFIAVMEKQYNYAASTTSQDVFHHVVRKLLPSGTGITINNLVDGTVVNQTESYTFTGIGSQPAQNSYDLWTSMSNLEVVVFVQNVATKEIYQAALANRAPNGLNDLNNGFDARIFPNPVADQLILNITTDVSKSGNIEILNTLGQVVVTERIEAVNAGESNFRIKTDNMESGIYFARVNFGDKVQTIKFTVAK